MTSFRLIGDAWSFFRRQPALQRSTVALVFLPLLAMSYLDATVGIERPEHAAVLVVLYLASYAALTWGTACTLVAGRRLLQAKAGRHRTSFKAVRSQATGLIVALILTDILRGCIALLWSLPAAGLAFAALSSTNFEALLLEPFADSRPFLYLSGTCLLLILPLLYLLFTTLAPQVVAYEKIAFRQALRRSMYLTKKRIGSTLVVTTVLSVLWLPGIVSSSAIAYYANPTIASVASPIVSAVFDTVAMTTWLLALTLFYKALGGRVRQSHPDNEEDDE